MHCAAEKFLDEIRTAPGFVDASKHDPKWLDELDDLVLALDAIYGNDSSGAVQASDRITAMVRSDAPLKQRLLAVQDIMQKFVDGINKGAPHA